MDFERAACQVYVGYHVADFGLNGDAASDQLHQRGRQTFWDAADQDARGLQFVPAIVAVDDGQGGLLLSQYLILLQSRL